jgi:hypothetical protein
MGIKQSEFEEAEKELEKVIQDPSVFEEEYTEITDQVNQVPDQLIWKYIYTNIGGSLRRNLVENPPESFPHWLKELFAEEYVNETDRLPADEFINKAIEHLVHRRMIA